MIALASPRKAMPQRNRPFPAGDSKRSACVSLASVTSENAL